MNIAAKLLPRRKPKPELVDLLEGAGVEKADEFFQKYGIDIYELGLESMSKEALAKEAHALLPDYHRVFSAKVFKMASGEIHIKASYSVCPNGVGRQWTEIYGHPCPNETKLDLRPSL